MRGIRYDPERRKGSTLPRRTDLLATLARLAAACFALSFALLLAPENAYAVTYGDVIYGPTAANGPVDSTSYYVQVYAFDRYTAALGALGYNPQDARFTSDVKAYLSNSSTGGAFYDFAQQFSNSAYENDGGSVIGGSVGIDVENSGMYFAYRQNVNLYGSNVWWANYTTTQSVAARTSVGLVLAGEIAGGGSGGSGDIPTNVTLEYAGGRTGGDNGFLRESCTYDVTISDATKLALSGYLEDYPYVSVGCVAYLYGNGSNAGGTRTYSILLTKNPVIIDTQNGKVTSDDRYVSLSQSNIVCTGTYPNFSLTITGTSVINNNSANSTLLNFKESSGNTLFFWNGVSSGPVVPPTNWPTDPTPEPPTDPVVPDPPTYGTPTQPTIPGPTADPVYGTQTIYITNNFTADFQGIIDALDEHCRHLQNALYTNLSDFYTKLTTKMTNDFSTLRSFLHGQFGWLGDGMVDIANDMMDYLHDLFEWLAEQFDFSVSGGGYDDNTVVAWLKKIYSKLGGGVNTRPTDPVSDPIGFGDWLNQLLQNFVLDLLAMGQNVIADLVESFRELITKFPFSIPWDIAAFLALLVAEPVAPNINWPVYTVSGNGLQQVATCEIDLEDYDSIMGGVRAMETLLFACWLAFKIDFFKGVVSGIGGSK